MERSVQDTSTSPIADSYNEACSSTQGDVLNVKVEDLDVGPTELQHMDIHYTINKKASAAAEVKTESVEDNLRGTDERQLTPATSTSTIVSRTNAAADNLEQDQLLHIKEIKEDEDLDIEHTVLQHMDSYYRTNQIDLNSIKQENTIIYCKSEYVLPVEFEDDRVLSSQVKKEIVEGNESSSKGSYMVQRTSQSLELNVHKNRLESICRVQLRRLDALQCELCYAVYKTKERFLIHLQSVHGIRVQSSSFAKFIEKMKQAQGLADPERVTYHCDKCMKTFQSRIALRRHCGQVHQTGCFKCTECNKEYKSKQYLRSHVRYVHRKNNYECDICKKIIRSKGGVTKHLLLQHRHLFSDPESGNHNCDKCMKTFPSRDAFNRHCRVVHQTGCFKCTECNGEYKNEAYLRRHINDVHKNRSKYECDICKKLFITKRYIYVHISTIHRDLFPDVVYRCDKCPKTYNFKKSLSNHRIRNHSTGSYKCTECNKEFKCQDYLGRHVRRAHCEYNVSKEICKSK